MPIAALFQRIHEPLVASLASAAASDPRIGLLGLAHKFVGADRQGGGEPGEVVQG